MELADGKIVKTGLNSYAVSYGDDNSNYVEFQQEAVPNGIRSTEKGCPQFDNKDFIKIMFPGDKTKIVHRPVKEDDKLRYPKQWAAYKKQEEQVSDGLPVTQWPPLTKGEAMSLKAMNIHTVEALAALPDTALTWFGARQYRDKAVAFLAQAKDGSVVLKLKAENDTLKSDLEALKAQVQELAMLNKKVKETK